MADPLSIAAAGAGFLSLAGQVGDGIVKLNSLYTTIKNAPQSIRRLKNELESLKQTLVFADEQLGRSLSNGIEKAKLGAAFADCEKMRYDIEAVLQKLTHGIGDGKATAWKFVFKKDEVNEMLTALGRSKETLLLTITILQSGLTLNQNTNFLDHQRLLGQQLSQIEAVTVSSATENHQSFSALSKDVENASLDLKSGLRVIKDAQTASTCEIRGLLGGLGTDVQRIATTQSDLTAQEVLAADRNKAIQTEIDGISQRLQLLTSHIETVVRDRTEVTQSRTTKFSFHLVPLGFSFEQTTAMATEHSKDTTVVRKPTKSLLTFRLPKWFIQDQYEFQLYRATSGWPLSFTTWRIVPNNSPFFVACETDNIEAVKELLSTGQASVYDRDEVGNTSFERVMRHSNLAIAKLLRQEGIFAQFRHEDYLWILTRLDIGMDGNAELELSALQLIEPSGNLDPDWYEEFLTPGSLEHANIALTAYRNNRCSAIRLQNYHDFIRCYYKFFGRLGLASQLAKLLSDTEIIHSVEREKHSHAWLLFALAKTMSSEGVGSAQSANIMKALLRAGIDPHAKLPESSCPWTMSNCGVLVPEQSHMTVTPLTYLLIECFDFSEDTQECIRYMGQKLESWVHALSLAGLDLMTYGRKEKPAVESSLNSFLGRLATYSSVTLDVGHHPNDWHLSLDYASSETFANHFWHLVDGNPIAHHLASATLQAWHQFKGNFAPHSELPGAWQSDSPWTLEHLEESLLHTGNLWWSVIEIDVSTMSSEEFLEKWKIPPWEDFGWGLSERFLDEVFQDFIIADYASEAEADG